MTTTTEKSSAINALEEFRKRYPQMTSGDLQTFVLGYSSNTESYKLLNAIMGFLAYHGTVSWGMIRENFGERLDAIRKEYDKAHIRDGCHILI